MTPNHLRTYEIRCPLHGFVRISDWERAIVSQPAFQRLRRIRQLAWTDQVYPGAMHTRFEHSLGVMHVATEMYDSIVQSSEKFLLDKMEYNEDGLNRDRILVRLTALLHDVGHAPFSHASEELFPLNPETETLFEHEDYSAAIIRTELKDAIETHPLNQNYNISANDIANLLEGNSDAGRTLIWGDLISGQMDADRIDYLLRDSLHAGVDYGRFDWRRLINCLEIIPSSEDRGARLGVTEGGLHAAESLVLARYFMFTQVYFHKTRVAFDHHLRCCMKELLPDGTFPNPKSELSEYLKWDDWRVLGLLSEGKGGEHGQRLATREHYREVFHTKECPNEDEIAKFDEIVDKLGDLVKTKEHAGKSWYKLGDVDIPVLSENPDESVLPLSMHSSAVARLEPIGKRMIYCRTQDKANAIKIVRELTDSLRGTE